MLHTGKPENDTEFGMIIKLEDNGLTFVYSHY